ncbi:MAG: ATP-binding protein [Anaerolineae bacterium]|jgi:two-component system phosphate regulon sensor histidine kinase PhoR
MMFRSIRWRIAVPYVVLILIAMLGLTIYVSDQVRQARLDNLQDQLLADARLLSNSMEPLLANGMVNGEIDATAKLWADLLDARVTIIAADGTVLGESHVDRLQMDNHLGRPEVQQALGEGQGGSTRFSRTVGYDMMYAAALVTGGEGQQPLGFVRVSLPLEEIEANVGLLRNTIVSAGLITAFLAAVLALLIAERTAAPVRRLTEVADRMAEGDLEARLLPSSRDEVGQLTRAYNRMADQLRAQVTSLAEEQGRLAAVLDHMADGVLITDENGHVQLINRSAARLFETSEEDALGRSFAQVVPHHQLIDLWKQCRDEGEEQIETVEITHHDLFLQAFFTPFQGGGAPGYLVILQDLTRIRRLETVRRDFISNISHELRTPLAGLKALVDTLRGGAIKDPPAAKRFLKRMDSEVDTLTQMVQELLDLSRVESGQAPLHLEQVAVADLIVQPVERLRPQARRAGLELSAQMPPHLPPVMADAERIQMVVTNLIHNAVKFTEPGGKVVVSASARGPEVVISVRDTGVGIPAEDLPRIFERFYKADQARSGGGTGLGLAIAKHILQSHGGRIWVESVEGEGSTFFFSLSIAQ